MHKPVKKYSKRTIVIVRCALNNTLIYVKTQNSPCFVVSSGIVGFKGAKRSTPQAAQDSAQYAGKKLRELKLRKIVLVFKGFGRARKAVLKGLKKRRILIEKILDKTLIAHNGCRLTKKKRK
jgi:small subunit ribosomal protein S11